MTGARIALRGSFTFREIQSLPLKFVKINLGIFPGFSELEPPEPKKRRFPTCGRAAFLNRFDNNRRAVRAGIGAYLIKNALAGC